MENHERPLTNPEHAMITSLMANMSNVKAYLALILRNQQEILVAVKGNVEIERLVAHQDKILADSYKEMAAHDWDTLDKIAGTGGKLPFDEKQE